MSNFRISGSRILLGVAVTAVALFYFSSSSAIDSKTPANMASRESPNPIAGLHVALAQTSSDPPTLRVTVTNKNDFPVTFLTYGSPLDKLALQLGLLSITPDGASAPLEMDTIQLRRVWPPTEEFLVTLGSGESESNELVLKEPIISLATVGSKAKVAIKGKWDAVWSATKDGVSKASLEDPYASPDVVSGDFESKDIDISIA
ncbi:hypothetical protein S40288_05562 [Stachybotrys chartarum IBT 40288]|nr:hypothetical protein S40288_05562 [Stachybotrys chartarum IBT 40288]